LIERVPQDPWSAASATFPEDSLNVPKTAGKNLIAREIFWQTMTNQQQLRILVVDDEALIRWALSELLRVNGHIVVEAASASAARAAIDESAPAFDVILLDYRLPDSNDLKLLEEIRRRVPTSAVVLMTAYGAPEVVKGAMQLGVYRVVDKPFDMDHVETMVRSAYQAMRLH
jgi:DNA-binding NtrC family response regulator